MTRCTPACRQPAVVSCAVFAGFVVCDMCVMCVMCVPRLVCPVSRVVYSVGLSPCRPCASHCPWFVSGSYEQNPDIWEKVPRGCAIFVAYDTRKERWAEGSYHMCWAVRANKKFTGHEDEEAGDSKLSVVFVLPARRQ